MKSVNWNKKKKCEKETELNRIKGDMKQDFTCDAPERQNESALYRDPLRFYVNILMKC